MTFSIVIPAYNGSKFIEKAILSALSQTRMPDEIIVHDDNSTDSTRAICERFKSKVKYLFNSEGPSGFVNGWNKAISLATAEYISILHQDDILYPTFLEEAESILKENKNIRHLFSLCDYIDKNDKITQSYFNEVNDSFRSEIEIFEGNKYFKAYRKEYNGILHIHRCPGVITHRSIFENECKFNPNAGHIADDDFFYRVGKYTSVIGILKPLSAFRIHVDSETGSLGDLKLVKRLANDYLFQIKQWEFSDFIDNSDKFFFVSQARKFSRRLLGYGIRNMSISTIIEALNLFRQIK